MSLPLNKATFSSLLNSKFKITFDEDNEYEAELIEISDGKAIPSLNLEPFSLIFRADPSQTIFAQRIYTIFSEATGPIDLFLIPRAPDKEGIYYEVIFN